MSDNVSKHETALNLPKLSQLESESILDYVRPSALSFYPEALTEAEKMSHIYDPILRGVTDIQNNAIAKSIEAMAKLAHLDDSFIKRATDAQNSATSKVVEAMAKLSYLDDSFIKRATDAQNSATSKAVEAMAKLSYLDDSFIKRATDAQNSATSKAVEAMAKLSYLDDSFIKRATDAQNSAISKAVEAMTKLSYLDDSFIKRATDAQNSATSKVVEAMAKLSYLDDSFIKRATDAQNSAISKAVEAMAKLSLLDDSFMKDALKWPHSPTGNIIAEKVKFLSGRESIFWTAVETGRRTETTDSPQEDKSNNSFAEIFKSLPLWAQQFFLWLVFSILVGALEDLVKEKLLEIINNTEGYILSLTEGKAVSKTSIISSNTEVAWDELNKFRTITAENVRLRKSPSMNSEVIEVLNKNRVVAILDTKDRQWLFVQVIIGGEKLQGWVNRSYTKQLGL